MWIKCGAFCLLRVKAYGFYFGRWKAQIYFGIYMFVCEWVCEGEWMRNVPLPMMQTCFVTHSQREKHAQINGEKKKRIQQITTLEKLFSFIRYCFMRVRWFVSISEMNEIYMLLFCLLINELYWSEIAMELRVQFIIIQSTGKLSIESTTWT